MGMSWETMRRWGGVPARDGGKSTDVNNVPTKGGKPLGPEEIIRGVRQIGKVGGGTESMAICRRTSMMMVQMLEREAREMASEEGGHITIREPE
jgi:hypothetical protein